MQNKDTKKGCLVISLDFEMMWGCHEWSTIEEYGMSNVANVREVITKMLELFKKYNIHATFATVGMIMAKDKSELKSFIPTLKPQYSNVNKSPYKPNFIDNIESEHNSLYFAPDIVDLLKETKGIEVGTHTFSHYFCWGNGQSLEEFDADLEAASRIASDKGINLRSIVFPKNEVDEKYLKVVEKYGIRCYRGNPLHFFDIPRNRPHAFLMKIGRLIDAYLPISDNLISYSEINTKKGLTNVRASRMFRPYNYMLRFLEPLRLHRIKAELKRAALKKKVYHLWWHPHNFGADTDRNLKNLEKVLKAYSKYSHKYGMISANMTELASYLKK